MKRREFVQHLLKHCCRLVREGGDHSIWENHANKRRSAVPRHRELVDFTVIRICKQLEIPSPF
jgi:predicted RNA binding protein YcfA (HicA-like mRNA interferase family)